MHVDSHKQGREISGTLEVYLMGLVDFDSALVLQERLANDVCERGDKQGKLLLCEHPPMITIGREGSAAHVRVDERELVSQGLDVRWLNRGGGCIMHAPGQLAVYPIVPLDRLGIGVSDYRRRLEQAVVAVCRELRVPCETFDDKPGVWCRTGKFAEVGVAVRSWVTHHGLFLNVAPPLGLLKLVDSQSAGGCDTVTTLAAERHHAVSMHVVREALLRHLARELGYYEYHLYTGHPLLKRTRRRVHARA